MRRGAIVQLTLLALLIGGAVTVVAVYPHWLPPTASEQADRIDFVFWYVTAICIAIYAIVIASLLYSAWKFRAAPDDDADGPPVHGHTGLEIAWTAIPFVLVTSMAIISAVVLARNDRVGSDPLRVDVTAQQFAWTFKYPQQKGLTTNILRLPIHRPTRFTLRALDVIHSFWVPEFGQKQDLVPGIETKLVITPKRLGTYPIACTELCGEGHALMRSEAVVMKPAAFTAWVKAQEKAAASAAQGSAGGGAGLAAFNSNGCSACHTYKPAGSTATTGPDLDNLAADARRAGQPLVPFVSKSIVDPNAYIEKGYQPNIMPDTFKSLPKQQLDALVQFLTAGKK
jgi:cytochrome c oxidase subunit 2